jgi:hypothetical protein
LIRVVKEWEEVFRDGEGKTSIDAEFHLVGENRKSERLRREGRGRIKRQEMQRLVLPVTCPQ